MFLKPNEIEEAFGVSHSSLLAWERRGYLSPNRTPGGHRRYRKEEIEELLRVAQNPIHYRLYFDNYAIVPDIIQILGSYTVGNPISWENESLGYSKIEMGIYKREGESNIVPLCLDIILQNQDIVGDTGIKIWSQYMRYTPYTFSNDKSLVLTTKDIWSNSSRDEIDNRHRKVPETLWVWEAYRQPWGTEIKNIHYQLQEIY